MFNYVELHIPGIPYIYRYNFSIINSHPIAGEVLPVREEYDKYFEIVSIKVQPCESLFSL